MSGDPMGAFDVVPFLVFGFGVPILATAVVLFLLYWIIRRAVAAGIRDARATDGRTPDVSLGRADETS